MTGNSIQKMILLTIVCLLFCPSLASGGFIDHFAQKNDIGRNKVPNKGLSRVLVIPVNLNTAKLPKLDTERIAKFFSDDPNRVNFPGYWRVNSLGKLKIIADIAKPVNYQHCPFNNSDNCTPKRKDLKGLFKGLPLIKEVLRRVKQESKLDFKRYDINGIDGKADGWSDGILILLNVGWFGVALPFGIVDENQTVEIDGVKINMVAISSGPRYLPMAIHEYGHLLGFADLYDEYRNTYGLQLSSMGNWRYDYRKTPLLDPFSKMQIGWADVVEISGIQEILLAPAQSGKVYKLGRKREFFLIENRQANRPYDLMIASPGISVFHVNLNRMPGSEKLDFLKTVVDCLNCRKWHPFMMNVQADGKYDVQYKLKRFENRDLFRSGDAFLPDRQRLNLSPSNVWFSSNYYNGNYSGISITNIDSDSFFPFIRATLEAPLIINDQPGLQTGTSMVEDRMLAENAVKAEYKKADMMNTEENKTIVMPAYAIGSSCMSIEDIDWRILPVILFLVWLIFRSKIKIKVEQYYRKKGKLKQDEDLKNRF